MSATTRVNRLSGLQALHRDFADLLRDAVELLPPDELYALLSIYEHMLTHEQRRVTRWLRRKSA